MKKQRPPFYKRLPYIITLFILLPPIGIPLLFKYSKKPSRNFKIALSVIWSIVWIAIIVGVQLDGRRTFTINNQSFTITCSSYCSYIDGYGDKDALKLLAGMGIKEVKSAPVTLKDNRAEVVVDTPISDASKLTLEYSNGKVSKMINADFTDVVYYSINSSDKVANYPAKDQIGSIKVARQKEVDAKKQAEDAAKAQQAQQDAERQAAEAKAPSSTGTVELCEKYFHQQYPFKGSDVHSVLGVIANTINSTDTRLYKAEVTIENGFGAKYDAVMECVVKKTGDTITIDSFNIYR